MEIVAHRELISQALQNGDVAREHVIERHGIAAAVVIYRGRIGGGINNVGVVGDHEGIKIVQATRRVLPRGVLDVAV